MKWYIYAGVGAVALAVYLWWKRRADASGKPWSAYVLAGDVAPSQHGSSADVTTPEIRKAERVVPTT